MNSKINWKFEDLIFNFVSTERSFKEDIENYAQRHQVKNKTVIIHGNVI